MASALGGCPFCYAPAMEELGVKVEGTPITVTMPGTDFWVIYRKQAGSPHLILTGSWINSTNTSPAVSKFRARAFQAAVAKARELGWIV